MSKVNRIDVNPVDYSSDQENMKNSDSTAVCYRPFTQIFKGKNQSTSEPHKKRKKQTRTAELIGNSLISLSLAVTKVGPADVYQAAKNGLVDDLERGLKSRYHQDRINYPDENGLTLMHLAAIHNHGDIIDCLVIHGGETNIKIGDGEESPLHVAAKHNSCDAIRTLIQNDASIDSVDRKGRTPLHICCKNGCNEAVEVIMGESNPNSTIPHIINCHDKERTVPLHLAAISCTVRSVELLLHHGANIYRKDIGGHTALHLAIKRKRTDIIQLLLRYAKSKGNNDYVSIANEMGLTAIHFAVDSGSIKNTELCLQYDADIENQSNDLLTPLHVAALNGFYDIVNQLIKRGSKVNTPDSASRTGLHYAAISNNVKIMKLLLDNDAYLEAMDGSLQTPLMVAVSHDCSDAIAFLLEQKAAISGQDIQGRTVLHIVADKGTSKSFKLIMQNGGIELLNVPDNGGLTPLLLAAESGALTILYQILTMYGDQIKVHEDSNGNNIYHLAAKNNHRDTIKALTVEGESFANVNARNILGQRAVHLAAVNGNNRVIIMLTKRGADINCRDNRGFHPIHYAAKYGYSATVKLLLSLDDKVDIYNDAKKTPLLIACEMGFSEVVQILLDHGADPTLLNDKGQNCLDIACEYRSEDIGLKIIKTKFWQRVMENRAYDGYNPMKRLIERLPKVAEAVMDKSFTFTKSKYGREEWKQVNFDLKFIESPPEDVHLQDVHDKYIAVNSISQYKRTRLMKHPLIKAFIFWKWKSVLNYLYFLKIFTDIIYLFGLSIPIGLNAIEFLNATSYNGSTNRYDMIQLPGSFGRNLAVFITVTAMLTSLLYYLFAGKRVFLDLMKQNLFEVLIAAVGYVYCLPFNKPIDYSVIRVGAILVFLLFVNIILVLRNLYGIGLYIAMFLNIIKTIFMTSFVFMLFVVAFALSFTMILNDLPFFSSLDYSVVTVMTMMVGELGYYEAFERLKSTGRLQGFKIELLLFVAMIIVINIAFANLLVGLAVGDIHEVRESANLDQLDGQLQVIIGSYEAFPLFLKKKMYKSTLIFRIDQNTGLFKRRQWNFLTAYIKPVKEDSGDTCQESELTELKNRVAAQEIEMIRMKELLEDVKSDVNFQGTVARFENKEIMEQLQKISKLQNQNIT
ncbi:Transient receptor potential cation channel subfamily A member 1 [Trichoplax sp. H2]|nr:Transient receptor potential cation channel subfamily A member 1 [Trichoplax sp. H2]|eukprot:RDD39278.1 Transient receptor potential cation channel subfamily A member 1 [Trichoplax sp. H2]